MPPHCGAEWVSSCVVFNYLPATRVSDSILKCICILTSCEWTHNCEWEVWCRKGYPEGMFKENGHEQWIEGFCIMRQRCLFFEQHCGGGGSVYISKNLSCHLMGSRRLSSFLLSPCKLLYCVIPSVKFTVPCLRVLGCPFRFSSCSGRTGVGG